MDSLRISTLHADQAVRMDDRDPFAKAPKKSWGFLKTRRLRTAREMDEKIRDEEAYKDLRYVEAELAAMETEEKLSWDEYELPFRNRLRLIKEQEARSVATTAAAERARAEDAMGYQRWYMERMFLIAPAAAYVGQWLQSFREFPPRQKPGSFNLERAMEKVTSNAGNQ